MVLSVAGIRFPMIVCGRRWLSRSWSRRTGTLLGAVPNPILSDHHAELGPGDALLLYSDGLTLPYAPDAS